MKACFISRITRGSFKIWFNSRVYGRLPVIANLEPLDEDALVDILTKPKNALVKQFQKLLELDDVELEFEEGALIEIAKKQLNVKRCSWTSFYY